MGKGPKWIVVGGFSRTVNGRRRSRAELRIPHLERRLGTYRHGVEGTGRGTSGLPLETLPRVSSSRLLAGEAGGPRLS